MLDPGNCQAGERFFPIILLRKIFNVQSGKDGSGQSLTTALEVVLPSLSLSSTDTLRHCR